MASRVACATPPSVPDVGEGRMNAFGSTARRDIRVLSPRIEPPDRADDGSPASTATLEPPPGTRRVAGEPRHLRALAGQRPPERVDERRLADPGDAADADPARAARVRQ